MEGSKMREENTEKMHIKSRWGSILLVVSICSMLLYILLGVNQAFAIEKYKRHYLDGLEYKENGQYEAALKEFAQAISENDKEQKKIRFYGMRYNDYLPHREKGICHYELKQYNEALKELTISIQQLPTPEAEKYINLTKIELNKLKVEKLKDDSGTEETLPEIISVPEELKHPREAKSKNVYGVAVVIGNRAYKHMDIPPVDYAIQDAEMVKKFLIQTFGYREGNIIYETNATKGTLESIFGTVTNHKGKLYDYIKPGKSDVFIYYSGHGAPSLESKKGYILPVDGNPDKIVIGGYSLDLLYSNLAKLQARSVTVSTDACFSGATIFKKASPVGIIVTNPLVGLKNSTILNSSAGTELSSWYPEKGHGLFTYFFLLGLTGKADSNMDKQITFAELCSYMNNNVPYMARKLYDGRKQTPSFYGADHDKVLVRYK